MGKRRASTITIGTASVILILIVFALSVFAVLSIKASNNDLILARKTRDSIEAYSQADSEAEHTLAEISQVLGNYYNDTSGIALKVQLQEVVGSNGKVEAKTDKVGTIVYTVGIDKYSTLEVEISYSIEVANKKHWDITKWRVNQSEIGDNGNSDSK